MSRTMGKSEAMRKMMREFTAKNPDAVIMEWSAKGVRIEKPVKGEVLPPERLEHIKP